VLRRFLLCLALCGGCGRIGFDARAVDARAVDARAVDATAEPIRFIQTHADLGSNANVLSTTFDAEVTAGSSIIVGVDFDHTAAEPVVSVTDNAGRTYQALIGPVPTNSNTQSQYLFSAYAAAAGPTTITANLTRNANLFFELKAFEYGGLAMAAPVDVTSSSSGTKASAGEVDATPIVTTGTNEVILALEVCGCVASGGPGMTVRSTFNQDVFQELLAPVPGSYVMKTVLETSGQWRFVMAAFHGQ
jgi:hypothetical protein